MRRGFLGLVSLGCTSLSPAQVVGLTDQSLQGVNMVWVYYDVRPAVPYLSPQQMSMASKVEGILRGRGVNVFAYGQALLPHSAGCSITLRKGLRFGSFGTLFCSVGMGYRSPYAPSNNMALASLVLYSDAEVLGSDGVAELEAASDRLAARFARAWRLANPAKRKR